MDIDKERANVRKDLGKQQAKKLKEELKANKVREKQEAKKEADYAKRMGPAKMKDIRKERHDERREQFDRAFSRTASTALRESGLTLNDVGIDMWHTPIEQIKQVSNLLEACKRNNRRIKPNEIKLLFSDEYTKSQKEAIYSVLKACYNQSESRGNLRVSPSLIIKPNRTAEEMLKAAEIVEKDSYLQITDPNYVNTNKKIDAVFLATELKKMKAFTPQQMSCFDEALERGCTREQLMLLANLDLNPEQMQSIMNSFGVVPDDKIAQFAKPEFSADKIMQFSMAYNAAYRSEQGQQHNPIAEHLHPEKSAIKRIDNCLNSNFSFAQLQVILKEATNGDLRPHEMKLLMNPKIDAQTMGVMADAFHSGMHIGQVSKMLENCSGPEQMAQVVTQFQLNTKIYHAEVKVELIQDDINELEDKKNQLGGKLSQDDQEKLDNLMGRREEAQTELNAIKQEKREFNKSVEKSENKKEKLMGENGRLTKNQDKIKQQPTKQPSKSHSHETVME